MSVEFEKRETWKSGIGNRSDPNRSPTPIAKRTRSARRRNQYKGPFLRLVPSTRLTQKHKRSVRKEVKLSSILEIKLERILVRTGQESTDFHEIPEVEHEESKQILQRLVIPQLEIVQRPIGFKLFLNGELYISPPNLATIRTFKPVIFKALHLPLQQAVNDSTLIGYVAPSGSSSKHISFAVHVTNKMHRKLNDITKQQNIATCSAPQKRNLKFGYNNNMKCKPISKPIVPYKHVPVGGDMEALSEHNFKKRITGNGLILPLGEQHISRLESESQGSVAKFVFTNNETLREEPSHQSAMNGKQQIEKHPMNISKKQISNFADRCLMNTNPIILAAPKIAGLENVVFEPYVPDKIRSIQPAVPKTLIFPDDLKNLPKPLVIAPPKILPKTRKPRKMRQTRSAAKARSTISRNNMHWWNASGNQNANVQVIMQRNVSQAISQPQGVVQNRPAVISNCLANVSYNNFLQINYFPNYIVYSISPFPIQNNRRTVQEDGVSELKNDISRTYNLGGDIVPLNELFLLGNNEFLKSNVRMSDIFP